jgi:hypothetical protein
MMTEKDHVLAAIARIEAKRDAQRDSLCRRYYELCLVGWEAHLKRLQLSRSTYAERLVS